MRFVLSNINMTVKAVFLAFALLLFSSCTPDAEIQSFDAAPIEVFSGDEVQLSFLVKNSKVVEIQPGVGQVAIENGKLKTISVFPEKTTTYILTAGKDSSGAPISKEVVVKVIDELSTNIIAWPDSGPAPLNVKFKPDVTSGNVVDYFYWNFGNGSACPNRSDRIAQEYTCSYSKPGTYSVTLRVVDLTGTEQSFEKQITVNEPLPAQTSYPTLSISESTIVVPGQASTVNYSLGFASTISLYIEDRQGRLIKTLVSNQLKQVGSYSESWNATNDTNNEVAEGDYYAVLEYTLQNSSIKHRIDLRNGNASQVTRVPHSNLSPSFSPLTGQPMTASYTLSRPSDVTIYMSTFQSERLATIAQNQPTGAGSQNIEWWGTALNGKSIDLSSSQQYQLSVLASPLPDNVIFVDRITELSNLKVSPLIFSPTDKPAAIKFDVGAGVSTVELRISDMQTGEQVFNGLKTVSANNASSIAWDGKNKRDKFVPAGSYRITVRPLINGVPSGQPLTTVQRVIH